MEESHNPYAAPNAPAMPELPPLPDSSQRPELAGRGERLLAKIVDRLLYLACFLPFFVAALMHEGPGLGGAAGLAAFLGFAAMLGLFVYNLAMLGQSGQTLGKRWLGIRIVRSDGSDADLGRIFGLRMAVPWLIAVIVGPLFTLPDVLCIFGRDKRCVHDLMADTIVIVA
ncbi:MAG TPA: RDD family protein [Lysobacter sp.]|nr:RDD family protein [Lysobacter sp.]